MWDQENLLEKAQGLVSHGAEVEACEASKKKDDGKRQKIRGVAKRKKLGAQVAVNMHAICKKSEGCAADGR